MRSGLVAGLVAGGTLVGSALAVSTFGCAELPNVTAGQCGNLVVEAGEACDGTDPERCGAPGTDAACRLLCDPAAPSDAATCEGAARCGSDGVCRAWSGQFEPAEQVLDTPVSGVSVIDIDGDGTRDIAFASTVSADLMPVFLVTRPGWLGFDGRRTSFTGTGLLGGIPGVWSDLDGDGRPELLAATNEALTIHESDNFAPPIEPSKLSLSTMTATGLETTVQGTAIIDVPELEALARVQPVDLDPGGGSLVVVAENALLALDGENAAIADLTSSRASDEFAAIAADFDESTAELELAVSSVGGDAVEVWTWGAGGGTPLQRKTLDFAPSGLSSRTSDVLTQADVNGDGHLDLLVLGDAEDDDPDSPEVGSLHEVYVAWGVGDGTFHDDLATLPTSGGNDRFAGAPWFPGFPKGTEPSSPILVVADLDADGTPDVVTQGRPDASNPQGIYLSSRGCVPYTTAAACAPVGLDESVDDVALVGTNATPSLVFSAGNRIASQRLAQLVRNDDAWSTSTIDYLSASQSLLASDYDLDGDLDLLVFDEAVPLGGRPVVRMLASRFDGVLAVPELIAEFGQVSAVALHRDPSRPPQLPDQTTSNGDRVLFAFRSASQLGIAELQVGSQGEAFGPLAYRGTVGAIVEGDFSESPGSEALVMTGASDGDPDTVEFHALDFESGSFFVPNQSVPTSAKMDDAHQVVHACNEVVDLDGDGLDEVVSLQGSDGLVLGFDGDTVAIRSRTTFPDQSFISHYFAPGVRWSAVDSDDLDGDGLPELFTLSSEISSGPRGRLSMVPNRGGRPRFDEARELDLGEAVNGTGTVALATTGPAADGRVRLVVADRNQLGIFSVNHDEDTTELVEADVRSLPSVFHLVARDLDGDGVVDLVGGGPQGVWVAWGIPAVPGTE